MVEPIETTETGDGWLLSQKGDPARLLAAQLLDDQRQRWQRGERVLVEVYLQDQPFLHSNPDAVLDLIYAEVLLRQSQGETLQTDEYLRRFPQFAEALKLQIEVDQAIDSVGWSDQSTRRGSAGNAAPIDGSPALQHGLADYELGKILGRGGMGVVYFARQRSLNRAVALKMILAGSYAGGEELARFRREAQTAARLQHPNIVQVYEVGDDEGRPFFSLEYVDGGSLAQKLNGTPQDPKTAADLMAILARTMHYAHAQGVIHRDLKPANILLGLRSNTNISDAKKTDKDAACPSLAAFVPKITDFGVAKCLDGRDSQTQSGALLGTPSYMSPEQAAGKIRDIGPPTDIYALGAILYELLTGRAPFRATTISETLQQVQTQEAVPPRRLQPKMPRDLETICLKCLQKNLHLRYASADLLADDLERFVAGRPILARPIRPWERAIKWARRRPALAALIVVVVAAGTILSVGGWWSSLALRAAATREARHRHEAEENFERARLAVDQMLTEVGEVGLSDVPQMEGVRKRLLAKALEFYQTFLEGREDRADLRAGTGWAYLRLGYIQAMLGEHKQAEHAYNQGIKLLDELCQANLGGVQVRKGLGLAYHHLGVLFKDNARFLEAEKAMRDALVVRQQLAEEFPEEFQYQQDLEASRYHFAALLAKMGRRDEEAEKLYRLALGHQEQLVQRYRAAPECQAELARTCNNLGILLDASDQTEAEKAFRDAVEIDTRLVAQFPGAAGHRHRLARSYSNLGSFLKKKKRPPQEVEEAYRASLGLLGRLAGDFPLVPDYQQLLAAVQSNLGQLLSEAGRHLQAVKMLDSAISIREKLAAQFPHVPDYQLKLGMTLASHGRLVGASGRSEEARAECRRGVEVLDKLVADFPNVPSYQSALGANLNQLARLLLDKSEMASPCQYLQMRFIQVPGNTWSVFGPLAEARSARVEARQCLLRAIGYQRNACQANPNHPAYRDFLRNDHVVLAVVLLGLGEHTAAAAQVEELPRLFPEDYQEYFRAAYFVAQCITRAAGDPRLAEARRRELSEAYAARTIELLQLAVDKGFRDFESLKQLPAFAPLRGRVEFDRLIKKLERSKKTAIG